MTCNVCLHEGVCPHLTNEDAERCKQFADKNEYIRVGKYKKKYSTNGTRKTIGQIIREKRKERGWTLEKLAGKLGVTLQTLSHWERNESTPKDFLLFVI